MELWVGDLGCVRRYVCPPLDLDSRWRRHVCKETRLPYWRHSLRTIRGEPYLLTDICVLEVRS